MTIRRTTTLEVDDDRRERIDRRMWIRRSGIDRRREADRRMGDRRGREDRRGVVVT